MNEHTLAEWIDMGTRALARNIADDPTTFRAQLWLADATDSERAVAAAELTRRFAFEVEVLAEAPADTDERALGRYKSTRHPA